MEYEIRTNAPLMHVIARGQFTMAGIRALDAAFWSAWQPSLNRILMDYRGLTSVDLPVREFMAAGFESQRDIPIQGDRVRAVYVSTNDLVFGFTRIIQSVWEDHLELTVTRDMKEALEFLAVDPGALEAADDIASGSTET